MPLFPIRIRFKTMVFALLSVSIMFFWLLGLDDFFTLTYIKSEYQNLMRYYQEQPIKVILLFSLLYIISVAISFPGAVVLSLLGGALFGLFWGTLIVSFVSTIGATLAFLSSRILLKDWVKRYFPSWEEKINQGFKREGAFYLFSLRLMPIAPFFIVNLLMGLTSISLFRYFWVSQIGMIFGTFIYVNAGVQISKLNSLQEIFSPLFIGSCVLLALFPLLIKYVLQWIKHQKTK